MPGLTGIIKNNNIDYRKNIINSLQLMKSYEHSSFKDDSIFEDENIISSRCHLNVIGEKDSPYIVENLFCWVEGEIYNLNELNKLFSMNCSSFPEIILRGLKNNILESILKKVDGYYALVIYDKNQSILKIISDRHGLKPLYIWNEDNNFAWGSELKTFLGFENFRPVIDNKIIDCFMGIGHLMGDYTWFKSVNLLPPSTILTFDIKQQKIISQNKYWEWSFIQQKKISFDDAYNILGDLIKKSIQKRYTHDKKMSVSLSGGLDSRVLLAEVAENKNITAFTFAKANSTDLELAKRVTKIKNVNHQLFYMSKGSWLESRSEGIWRTDGLANFLHLHAAKFLPDIKQISDINLNGFAGDLICGGGWIQNINSRITQETAENKFKKYAELDPVSNHFYNINHEDPYYLNNRVRRFTNIGIVETSKFFEQRKPFYDNDLMEFVYSIDDNYRLKSKVYNQALLKIFPEYYENIPWQKTGMTINKEFTSYHRFLKKASRIPIKLGLIEDYDNYIDYKNWIKEKDSVEFFSNILNSKDALYVNYTKENYFNKYVIPHIENKMNFTEEIGRALTLEIWLQNVFNRNRILN